MVYPSYRRSACGIPAINSECVTDHEACARAAKPKNGSGDFLWPTEPPNRLVFHDVFQGVCFTGQHVSDHWRIDGPRADRIDADAPGGIFESSALCQPEHPMLGGVIYCSASYAHESAERRAVDDGTTSLLAHLEQLVLHAAPDAAEIDHIHAVELFTAGISGFCERTLHASIVECRIQPSEGGDSLFDHRCHLTLVGNVAADGECPMARGNKFLGCGTHRFLVIVRQHH